MTNASPATLQLHQALRRGDEAAIARALQAGANVQARMVFRDELFARAHAGPSPLPIHYVLAWADVPAYLQDMDRVNNPSKEQVPRLLATLLTHGAPTIDEEAQSTAWQAWAEWALRSIPNPGIFVNIPAPLRAAADLLLQHQVPLTTSANRTSPLDWLLYLHSLDAADYLWSHLEAPQWNPRQALEALLSPDWDNPDVRHAPGPLMALWAERALECLPPPTPAESLERLKQVLALPEPLALLPVVWRASGLTWDEACPPSRSLTPEDMRDAPSVRTQLHRWAQQRAQRFPLDYGYPVDSMGAVQAWLSQRDLEATVTPGLAARSRLRL